MTARFEPEQTPIQRQPKPDADVLKRWAMGEKFTPDPTGFDQWAQREWRRIEVQNARARGALQAYDAALLNPKQQRRVDWGAVHAAFWAVVLIIVASVAIAAVISA